MKKVILSVLMYWVIMMQFATAQIQQHNWILPTTDSLKSYYTNIQFDPAPVLQTEAPSYKDVPVVFTDENNVPITSYKGFNSFFDNDGFPILYVINTNHKTYLYDKNGVRYRKKHKNEKGAYAYLKEAGGSGNDYYEDKDYIEPFNNNVLGSPGNYHLLNDSREISIIQVACNKLHIVVGEMIIEADINLKSWDFFIPYDVSQQSVFTSDFLSRRGVTALQYGVGGNEWNESFHAVRRDPLNPGRYFIYYLYSDAMVGGNSRPTYLNCLTVDANLYTVSYGVGFDLRSASLPATFRNDAQFISELELSADGSKLAIHDLNKIMVFSIQSTSHQVQSLMGFYTYRSNSTLQNYSISGMEFNATSDKLVFNRFDCDETRNMDFQNLVGVLNILSPNASAVFPVTYFAELSDPDKKVHSLSFRGGLEMGRDGNIYMAGVNGLYRLNFVTFYINELPDVTIANGGVFNLTNDPDLGAKFAIRSLPEQIDGMAHWAEGYQFDDETLSATQTADLIFKSSLTKSGEIHLRGQIQIYTPAAALDRKVKFEEVRLYPASMASIIVQPGSQLLLENTPVSTTGCNTMWNGIQVQESGILSVLNSGTNEIQLADAITAINCQGTTSGLWVEGITFKRNAKAILINNGGTIPGQKTGNTQVRRNIFSHADMLKEPAFGQTRLNPAGYGKGIISIEVNNTGNSQQPLLLENNTFNGGIYGVKAKDSHIQVYGCDFLNHTGLAEINFFPRVKMNYATAVFMENSDKRTAKSSLWIDYSTEHSKACRFQNNSIHLTTYNGVHLSVYGSDFSNAFIKGIQWIANKGCSLQVKNNHFTNCSGSAIYCEGNGYPDKDLKKNSYLEITGNFFDNTFYNLSGNSPTFCNFSGNAITLTDMGKTEYSGYNHLIIESNIIDHLESGIWVNGVSGAKGNLTNPEAILGDYNIQYNSIVCFPTYATKFPNAVTMTNSEKVAIHGNYRVQIQKLYTFNQLGSGVNIENSNNLSIKNNLLLAKVGVRGKMNCTGSEILCNTFYRNRFGISVSDQFAIRKYFVTHGIAGNESRSNRFVQSSYSDLHRLRSISEPRNWWILEYGGLIKESCFRDGTTQDCFVGSNTVSYLTHGYAPDLCHGIFPQEAPGPQNIYPADNALMQWEQDFLEALSDTLSTPDSNPKTRLIQAQQLIMCGRYTEAAGLLQPAFADIIDAAYAKTLSQYLALQYPQKRAATAAEYAYFLQEAQKLPSQWGSPVYLARSIMLALFDESFAERDSVYPDLVFALKPLACLPQDGTVTLKMLDVEGKEVPIKYSVDSLGYAVVLGESIHQLQLGSVFTINITINQIPYFYSAKLADMMDRVIPISLNCNYNLGKRNFSENAAGTGLILYPNPAENSLNFKGVQAGDEWASIEIIDLTGRVCLSLTNWNLQQALNIAELGKGIYCLRIKKTQMNINFIFEKL